jgi:hypothetical protein
MRPGSSFGSVPALRWVSKSRRRCSCRARWTRRAVLPAKPRSEENLMVDRRERAEHDARRVHGVADDERERARRVLRLHGGGDGRCSRLRRASLLASAGRRLRGCLWLPPRQRAPRISPPLESVVAIERRLELVFESDLLLRWLAKRLTYSICGAQERRADGGAHPRRQARLQRGEPLAPHPVEL